jgi:tetratricopeptide (TPR) repeat protein
LIKENFKKAEEMVNEALKLDENFADALINLGLIKSKLLRFDEAYQVYKKAKELNPNNAILRNNLGNLLIIRGDIDLGINELKEAIKINKTYVQAHRHLTFAKKYQQCDPHQDQIKKLISDTNLSTDEKSQLHFALAKIYDDIGQYDKAFSEIITANKLAKLQTSYDFEKEFAYWTRIKKMYEAQIQEKKGVSYKKNYHKTPIFIVGMPRTGSSVLAELVSRYPNTKNLGETGIFEDLMFKYKVQSRTLSFDEINAIRKEFYDILTTFGSHISYVDKQLFNIYWVGYIKYIFPEAKMLLMVRDKSPTCWSIFKNYFSAKRYGFSYRPEIINKLFNLQTDVVKFWSEKNISIKKVNYGELVEAPNTILRNIYEYLDFEWDDTFLSSQISNKTIINTNSAIQARKPVYDYANKDWENYREFNYEIENLFS